MNKKAESQISVIILILVIVGLGASYFFGWISFDFLGGGTNITPDHDDLPESGEDEGDIEDTENPNTFQRCDIVSQCNWNQSRYYNRDCSSGAWRCLESPQVGQNLCSYGCSGNQYCGDGICGGVESEWTCIDCNPNVGFIGDLVIK